METFSVGHDTNATNVDLASEKPSLMGWPKVYVQFFKLQPSITKVLKFQFIIYTLVLIFMFHSNTGKSITL